MQISALVSEIQKGKVNHKYSLRVVPSTQLKTTYIQRLQAAVPPAPSGCSTCSKQLFHLLQAAVPPAPSGCSTCSKQLFHLLQAAVPPAASGCSTCSKQLFHHAAIALWRGNAGLWLHRQPSLCINRCSLHFAHAQPLVNELARALHFSCLLYFRGGRVCPRHS